MDSFGLYVILDSINHCGSCIKNLIIMIKIKGRDIFFPLKSLVVNK